jgi:Transcriptional regulator
MQKDIDLKLLKIINTLVVTGSVTKTAQLLNLSSGTISYSLKKARTLTGAHLFIRTKSGMKPDTTARELSQRYQRLTDTGTLPSLSEEAKAKDEITVMTYTPIEMMIAKAVKNIHFQNQRYRFSFLPYDSNVNLRLEKIKGGHVDIDIGSKLPADPLIHKVKLFSCPIVMIARRDTRSDAQLTLAEWRNSKHAVWSVFSDYYSDTIKSSQNAMKHINERNIAMISASIINMVTFCATTDCIMMIPDYFTPTLMDSFPVERIMMPAEIAISYDCYLHFNNAVAEDEALLEAVSDIANSLKARAFREFPFHE